MIIKSLKDRSLSSSLLLQRSLISVLQPALRRDLIELRIDILRSADASGKSDHTGNMNSNRTITTATEDTVSPHDPLDLHSKSPIHLTSFSI